MRPCGKRDRVAWRKLHAKKYVLAPCYTAGNAASPTRQSKALTRIPKLGNRFIRELAVVRAAIAVGHNVRPGLRTMTSKGNCTSVVCGSNVKGNSVHTCPGCS